MSDDTIIDTHLLNIGNKSNPDPEINLLLKIIFLSEVLNHSTRSILLHGTLVKERKGEGRMGSITKELSLPILKVKSEMNLLTMKKT